MYECIWSKGLVTEAAVGDIIDVAACTFVVIVDIGEPYESEMETDSLPLESVDGEKLIMDFRSMGDVTVELSDGVECDE